MESPSSDQSLQQQPEKPPLYQKHQRKHRKPRKKLDSEELQKLFKNKRYPQGFENTVRRILCWPFHIPLARCAARSRHYANTLAQKGDRSHLAPGHVCDVCRCKNVAGRGTKGDFYGLGNTGHVGVGFCCDHEKGKRKHFSESFARNQLRAFQIYGRAESIVTELAIVEQVKQEERSLVKAHSDALKIVQDELAEIMEKLKGENFTDKGKHGPETISDKARAELLLNVAKTLSSISMNKFKVQSSDMIERDVVKQRVTEMLTLVGRFVPEDRKQQFLLEFKAIWERV